MGKGSACLQAFCAGKPQVSPDYKAFSASKCQSFRALAGSVPFRAFFAAA